MNNMTWGCVWWDFHVQCPPQCKILVSGAGSNVGDRDDNKATGIDRRGADQQFAGRGWNGGTAGTAGLMGGLLASRWPSRPQDFHWATPPTGSSTPSLSRRLNQVVPQKKQRLHQAVPPASLFTLSTRPILNLHTPWSETSFHPLVKFEPNTTRRLASPPARFSPALEIIASIIDPA